MAHFRGIVRGTRGAASRLGGKKSGLHITADGWRSGVDVQLYEKDGEDWARISITGGSARQASPIVLYEGCLAAYIARNNSDDRLTKNRNVTSPSPEA